MKYSFVNVGLSIPCFDFVIDLLYMPEESAKYLFDDFPTEWVEVIEIPLSSSWRNDVFISVCYLQEGFLV